MNVRIAAAAYAVPPSDEAVDAVFRNGNEPESKSLFIP